MTLVITTCTNRKRKPISDSLRVSAIPQAGIAEVASDWALRLAAVDTHLAGEVYGGRSYQEAVLAADLLDARLMVVSAGLGLIFADERVPAYACTVLAKAPDSIGARVVGNYSIGGWWRALSAVSPYSQALPEVAAEAGGLVCAALSDAYLEMIADDLCALPAPILANLRLFTRTPLRRIERSLRAFVMPYDDRLDGPDSPIRGTRGDFAGRALRHFAEHIFTRHDCRSALEHGDAVTAALAGWAMAQRFDRRRIDDVAVLELIREHWDSEQGSTSRLLRRLRDNLGVACEQGRFASLARQVRAEQV